MPRRTQPPRRRPPHVRWLLAGVAAVALGVPSGAAGATFPTVSSVPVGIPDAVGGDCNTNAANGVLDVTFAVSGVTEALDDVRVSLALQHSYSSDVGAQLIAPGGVASHSLFERRLRVTNCGSDSDLDGVYVFADDGVDGFWTSTASGTYRTTSAGSATPTNLTAAFAGLTPDQINGTWTLRVTDYSTDDVGTLGAASLELNRATAPVLSSTAPASPAVDPTPRIVGAAPAGSTVRLYTTADCSGPAVATGTAAELATPGIEVTVPSVATTTIRATATRSGETSPCSDGIAYETVLPDAPVLSSTLPASPAVDVTPVVVGSAPDGSAVRLYATEDCSGTPLASGTAAELADPGLQVTVPLGTTEIRATAELDGVLSPCSASIAYAAIRPDAPVLSSTSPVSPSTDRTPLVVGSAPAGSTVRLYATEDCSGEPLASGTAAAFADPGLSVTVPALATTAIRATAELDGVLSLCSASIAYTHRPVPEPAPKPNPVEAPTPTDPGAGPLPVRPLVPEPPRCDRQQDRAIVLTTVQASGRQVRLEGLAWAPLAGRTADVRRDGRRIATVRIGTDGRFAQTVAAPTDRDAADRARYRIVVAGHMSLALRAERRLAIVARTDASSTRVQVRGRLGAQLSSHRGLTVERQSLCPAATGKVRRLRTDRDGRFTVTLLRPAPGQGPWIYRIRSAVPLTASVPIVVTAAPPTR